MPHFRPRPRRHRRTLLPVLLALILALCTGTAQAAAFPDLALNLAPESAAALGLGSGGPTSLSHIPAQALILVLMSYFCPPCHLEVPRIKDLDRRIHERGLAGRIRMLGLAIGDDQALVDRFLAQHGGLPFPLLPDPTLAAHKRLGNPVVPTLYILANRAGKLHMQSLRQGEFTEDPDAFLDLMLRTLPASPRAAPQMRAKR